MQLGLYQLLYMDGIPDFAAVNETVALAANRGENALTVTLPDSATELLSGKRCGKRVTVLPDEVKIWRVK